MLFHIKLFFGFSGEGSRFGTIYSKLCGMGWSGVDLFFVLSGFLITGILFDSTRARNYYSVFYARRTLRIFPLYYAFVFFTFWCIPLLLRWTHHENWIPLLKPETEPFAWLYCLNLLIGIYSFGAASQFMHHLWSLAIEEQFYLFWPPVVLRFSRKQLLGICVLMVILSLSSRISYTLLENL